MTTSYIQGALLTLEQKAVLEALRTDCLANGTNATAVQADLDATEATVVTDLGNLRTGVIAALTAIATLATAVNALAAKLNLDGGVTDADYVANNATNQVATLSPTAITTA